MGSQPGLLTLWYDGRAEIIPFRYLPVLLGGKGMWHVGWVMGACLMKPKVAPKAIPLETPALVKQSMKSSQQKVAVLLEKTSNNFHALGATVSP